MRVSVFLMRLLIASSTVSWAQARPPGESGGTQATSGLTSSASNADHMQNVRQWFEASGLKVGMPFPTVDIFDAGGRPFNTLNLKGQYTVLVNGCLT